MAVAKFHHRREEGAANEFSKIGVTGALFIEVCQGFVRNLETVRDRLSDEILKVFPVAFLLEVIDANGMKLIQCIPLATEDKLHLLAANQNETKRWFSTHS